MGKKREADWCGHLVLFFAALSILLPVIWVLPRQTHIPRHGTVPNHVADEMNEALAKYNQF